MAATAVGAQLRTLLLEPFYGGSHKQLLDLLYQELPGCVRYTMPAKKWHWRARTAALYMSQVIPASEHYRLLFCSSVLNLAELVALRPDLARLHKVLYFHENQMVYPVRKQQGRDFQFGYNQVLSCLVADQCVFNSQFNMDSMLDNIKSYMNIIPNHRPTGLAEAIRPKCKVMNFPINFPPMEEETNTDTVDPSAGSACESPASRQSADALLDSAEEKHVEHAATSSEEAGEPAKKSLHIVWPHRWEHDKDPDLFFQTLYKLKEQVPNFTVSVMGESYTEKPEIFHEAREKLSDHICTWGYQPSKEDYYSVLRTADVVVSTAKHEFFGVAMLEAAYLGCYPLCPNALVYPEIFPAKCLYNTPSQLLKKLRRLSGRPDLVRKQVPKMDLHKYSWEALSSQYRSLFEDAVTVNSGHHMDIKHTHSQSGDHGDSET